MNESGVEQQLRRLNENLESQAEALPDTPMGDVFDLGVVDLPEGEDIRNRENMPFDGFIYRVDALWPAGANNAIGFNLRVGREGAGVVLPTNYDPPNGFEFIAADNTHIPYFPIRGLGEGTDIIATIDNGSTSSELDLQLFVSITNFNPLLLPSGGI